MSNTLFNMFKYLILILIILIILISVFFIPTINSESIIINSNEIGEIEINPTSGFAWPTPGYTRINSPYGKRNSPTAGASSFHKGIDIGAPEGSYFIAVTSGTITYEGFLGGGGYTITITADEDLIPNSTLKISYCHCNPNFLVKEGEHVSTGQVIGKVGPKNVYGVPGNQYTDSDGNPTNGATTGPHLHLGMRLNGEYINPMNFY